MGAGGGRAGESNGENWENCNRKIIKINKTRKNKIKIEILVFEYFGEDSFYRINISKSLTYKKMNKSNN